MRMTVKERNRRARTSPVSRNTPTLFNERVPVLPQHRPSDLPKSTGVGPRKGKARQKIGMWGNISTDYKTPGMTTHDARYSQTVNNRNV